MAQQQNVNVPILPNAQPNIIAPAPDPAVNRIQIRVPPFWKQNPEHSENVLNLLLNNRHSFQ